MATLASSRKPALSRSTDAVQLTEADWSVLGEQAQRQGESLYQPLALGAQHNLPAVLGQGGDRIISLRHGLTLYIRNATLWRPLHFERCHNADFPLTATFYLSGSSRVRTRAEADVTPDYTEIAGCNYLYHLPNLTEVEEWPSDEVIRGVMICVPIDYFGPCIADATLSPPLARLLRGDRSQRFHQPLGQTTAAMNQVLQQILHAPYTGLTQQIYLESKALELLALQFSQWSDDAASRRKTQPLSASERDQLHAAKELLVQDLRELPLLGAIAQQVGLSEYRLKQGFQHLFGTTPFGYWQRHRLHLAQILLRESHLSIAGVATRVGYCNPEAFSTAFRRQFGISPKAYQLGKQP
ncbi:helix-turn-helix transcriptional regulator [Nodosilinea sp. PGN35]|uniref:helix-turn-helix transcriptional regulator n=1 Tax=Nodosilinea sp. PGN35 TaxID=3020489 RepID=UPI0023B34C52|nr:AraC family transcriptional regulator [Nodosilinea sp. TSF1-S3]MDF0366532.1 AraC family transcriptional regulator [Nodosilinea sp. TSF1-S3]